jgi:hypothetical protein
LTEPQETGPGTRLSPIIKTALPGLVEAVWIEIRRFCLP